MSLNLKQLEAFIWVADLGSFSKAADRLNTTQPNISARISALEDVLQTNLMDRDAGSVRLTARGQDLLVYARNVLQSTDELVAASGSELANSGVLRLGVTEMVVHTWLREFLRRVSEELPNISVELTVDMSVSIKRELFARTIDLAFQNGPFNRQTTGNRDLGVYPMVWVASPKLGLHETGKLDVKDMARVPILTHARETRSYEDLTAHLAEHRGLNVRLVPSSNLSASLYMTVEGMGVTALPHAMVKKELASGELIALNYPWQPESLSFMARYDAERTPQYVATAADIAHQVALDFHAT